MKYRFVLNLFAYLLVATVLTAAVAAGCGESSSTLEPVQQADSPDTGKAGVLPPTATPVPPGSENSLIGQPAPFLLEDLGLVGLDGWINSEPL